MPQLTPDWCFPSRNRAQNSEARAFQSSDSSCRCRGGTVRRGRQDSAARMPECEAVTACQVPSLNNQRLSCEQLMGGGEELGVHMRPLLSPPCSRWFTHQKHKRTKPEKPNADLLGGLIDTPTHTCVLCSKHSGNER